MVQDDLIVWTIETDGVLAEHRADSGRGDIDRIPQGQCLPDILCEEQGVLVRLFVEDKALGFISERAERLGRVPGLLFKPLRECNESRFFVGRTALRRSLLRMTMVISPAVTTCSCYFLRKTGIMRHDSLELSNGLPRSSAPSQPTASNTSDCLINSRSS